MPALTGALEVGRRTYLRRPVASDEAEFLARVRASRELHRPFVQPPGTPDAFRRYVGRLRPGTVEMHLVCRREGGAICGVMNLSEIVRGPLLSANLGYYAFVPFAGHGYMSEAAQLVLARAFLRLKLHRVEANVQPTNLASIALVVASGFRHEGYSPRYLKIGGRWRDHLRFAICVEDWRGRRRRRARPVSARAEPG